MTYNATISENIFKRLGFYIEWWYDLQDVADTVEALRSEATVTFLDDSGAGDIDETLYASICDEVARQLSELAAMKQSVVGMVSDFLTEYAKDQLDIPYATVNGVLEYLIESMTGIDTVLENTTSGGTPVADPDNVVDTVPTYSTTELARDNNHFSLVCIDDSTVDQERWTLASDRFGQMSGEVVTGTAADWAQAGIENLLIAAADAYDEDPSGLGRVTDWNLTGVTLGTHTDSDGRAYLKFHDAPAAVTHDNDDLNQLDQSTWVLNSPIFGVDSDSGGVIHVSVVKDPADYTVLGGEYASLDGAGIELLGVDAATSDEGQLYVKVEVSGTTYTVSLYNDPARSASHLVGTGSAVIDFDVVDSAEVTLDSGYDLTGTITMTGYDGVASEDHSIVIQVPLYYVRLYSRSSRLSDDRVTEGISYTPQASGASTVVLDPADGFSTSYGSVDLNYVQDNETIELLPQFYTIDLYAADPDHSATTTADIVGRAGDTDNLLTDPATGVAFYAANDSGLPSDVTIDLNSGPDATDGDVISAVVGRRTGDKFMFETASTDSGRYQTFLRDAYDTLFDSTASGETIDEAWAGA